MKTAGGVVLTMDSAETKALPEATDSTAPN